MSVETPPNLEDSCDLKVDSERVPLFVDLDGTLVRTDMLWESMLDVARSNPRHLLQVPAWLREGKAVLKRRLAERAKLDVENLPYREETLDIIRTARAEGRRVYLATATDERLAQRIAEHLGLFDGVIASDGATNRKGKAKLASIRMHVGGGEFDYLGDSASDLPILGGSSSSAGSRTQSISRVSDLRFVRIAHHSRPTRESNSQRGASHATASVEQEYPAIHPTVVVTSVPRLVVVDHGLSSILVV